MKKLDDKNEYETNGIYVNLFVAFLKRKKFKFC